MKKDVKSSENLISLVENAQINLQYDIDIASRTIFVPGDSENSQLILSDLDTVVKGISILESIGRNPIDFILTTAGGEEEIGFGIFDAIRSSRCLTRIICIGRCYSMGTIILQAADERYSYPNTRFMIHEGAFNSGASIPYKSLLEDVDEMKLSLDFMYKIYSERTGLSTQKLKTMCNRKDFFFGAEKAKELGFIDDIIIAR